jgi:hypothetical protein
MVHEGARVWRVWKGLCWHPDSNVEKSWHRPYLCVFTLWREQKASHSIVHYGSAGACCRC